jgi:hypothetical protein
VPDVESRRQPPPPAQLVLPSPEKLTLIGQTLANDRITDAIGVEGDPVESSKKGTCR